MSSFLLRIAVDVAIPIPSRYERRRRTPFARREPHRHPEGRARRPPARRSTRSGTGDRPSSSLSESAWYDFCERHREGVSFASFISWAMITKIRILMMIYLQE